MLTVGDNELSVGGNAGGVHTQHSEPALGAWAARRHVL